MSSNQEHKFSELPLDLSQRGVWGENSGTIIPDGDEFASKAWTVLQRLGPIEQGEKRRCFPLAIAEAPSIADVLFAP